MILDKIIKIEEEAFSVPWDKETYLEMSQDKKYTIITEEAEGVTAGFVVMLELYDTAEIIRIAVDKKFRKRGIASLLVNKVIEKVRKMGFDSIWLEVRATNNAAIELYKKSGFERVTVRKKYYSDNGEDGIVMKYNLS